MIIFTMYLTTTVLDLFDKTLTNIIDEDNIKKLKLEKHISKHFNNYAN